MDSSHSWISSVMVTLDKWCYDHYKSLVLAGIFDMISASTVSAWPNMQIYEYINHTMKCKFMQMSADLCEPVGRQSSTGLWRMVHTKQYSCSLWL